MMSDGYTALISLVFRLLNFTVFLVLIFVVYRKLIHESVLDAIEHLRGLLPSLEQDIVSLDQSCNAVDDALRDQRAQTQLLLQKVERWHTQVVQEQVERNQLLQQYQQEAHQRFIRQQEVLTQQRQIALLVPQVLARARQELLQDSTLHEHFMQRIRPLLQEELERKS